MNIRRGRTKKKGQALVELAVLFPFFLLVIVGGIIDFGFAFTNYLTLQEIANGVALYGAESNGSTGRSQSEIYQYALNKKPTWWSGSYSVQSVEFKSLFDSDGTPYRAVAIRLSYFSPVYTPFYQTMLGATVSHAAIPLRVLATYQIPSTATAR